MTQFTIRSNQVTDLNTKLGQIGDAMAGRLHGETHFVIAPATVGERFSVTHSLGVIPNFVIGVSDTGQTIGVAKADYKMWTTTKVYLRSQTAGTEYNILIAAVKA